MSLPNQKLSKELSDHKSIARAIVYFTERYLLLEKNFGNFSLQCNNSVISQANLVSTLYNNILSLPQKRNENITARS